MSVVSNDFFTVNLNQMERLRQDQVVSPFALKDRLEDLWRRFVDNKTTLLTPSEFAGLSYRISVLRYDLNQDINRLLKEWHNI